MNALLALTAGILSGAIAGLLLDTMQWWLKDLRDARLRVLEMPLPSDRVFGRFGSPRSPADGALYHCLLPCSLTAELTLPSLTVPGHRGAVS